MTRSGMTSCPDNALGRLDGKDADDASACAVVFKSDAAGDFREDRVVLSATSVEAGLEATTTLPHDDRTAWDQIAVVSLDTEALRIGIAAVS